MRAALYDRYGKADVVEIRDVVAPTPRPNEVTIRVRAAALNPKDIVLRSGRFALLSGTRFPRRVGFDFAGEILHVGSGVSEFAPGERVHGMLGGLEGGTCAEIVAVPARVCARMPESSTFEEAASLPLASLTALQALRDVGALARGGSVSINAASGGVGVHAIQIARALGARVTTISSAKNRDLCRSLGADVTLAYDEDRLFAERDAYDVVFDAFGNLDFDVVAPSLTAKGTFVSIVPKPNHALAAARTLLSAKRLRFVVVKPSRRDLSTIAAWIATGALRPVIDRVFPLDAIGDAMRHVETKRARGKVVIRIAD